MEGKIKMGFLGEAEMAADAIPKKYDLLLLVSPCVVAIYDTRDLLRSDPAEMLLHSIFNCDLSFSEAGECTATPRTTPSQKAKMELVWKKIKEETKCLDCFEVIKKYYQSIQDILSVSYPLTDKEIYNWLTRPIGG